jgi:hypothetical protein
VIPPDSYLVLIGREEVIGELCGEVLVPEAVRRVLVHPRGRDAVRKRISNFPSWIKVNADGSGAETLPLPEANRGDLKELDPVVGTQAEFSGCRPKRVETY